jgi:hypothetical protein
MTGSFVPYTASLRADSKQRRLVIGSGALFLVTGLLILAVLPVAVPWKWLLALGFTALSAAELAILFRAYRDCVALTLHADGSVEIEGPDGGHRKARLLPGSVVLRKWAWLRIQSPAAPAWAEPVMPGTQDREQWRRFQVICRHLTAC